MKHGKGVWMKGKMRFEGLYEQDVANGHGTCIWSNGDKYEGEYASGARQVRLDL